MSRPPLVVRLASLVGHLIILAYPASLRSRRADIRAFADDQLEAAWSNRGVIGLVVALWRLLRDVASARWRGPALAITNVAAPPRRPVGRPRSSVVADVWQDLRHEVRALMRRPTFTAAAALTLALGIGANTTVFTVVNGVLLRPLPYPASQDLVRIVTNWANFGQGSISEPEYFDILDRATSFTTIGLFRHTSVNLTEGTGDPEQVQGLRVTPGLFETLRTRAALGRTFDASAGTSPTDGHVILSDALWRARFGADPDIVGRSMALGSSRFRVDGVMPAGFEFSNPSIRLWLAFQPDRANPGERGSHSNMIVARLKPGVSTAVAQAELDRIAVDLRTEHAANYPADSGFSFVARPYLDVVTGPVRPSLFLLLFAASLVLLIACVNVANLFLARMAERQRQVALRAALGASAGRLVRQLVTGSLVVAMLGGVGGLAIAAVIVRVLATMPAAQLPRAQEIGIDGTVLLFDIALVVVTALVVGLLPARRSARIDLVGTLKEGGRGTAGAERRRTRSALVVVEVALATVLLVAAGLLLRSFSRTLAVDPGFRSAGVATGRLTLDPGRYAEAPRRVQFVDQVLARLTSRPGIVAAGMVTILPLSGNMSDWWVAPAGHAFDGDARYFIQYRLVTPGYFEAMQIPVLKGRNFSDTDVRGSPAVVIVSASLARMFWGSADPIGRRMGPNPDNQYTVVGVVGDVHNHGLTQGDTPMWYRPYAQDASWSTLTIVARASGEADITAIGAEVHAIDRLQPVFDVKPMSAWAADSVSSERLGSWLLGLLAALAVLLSGIGLYAVISYSVSLRTQEIGIRMALGADRWRVRRLVLWQGLALTGAGLTIGVALALWLTRTIASRLYGVTTTDAPTYAGAAVLLALVALAADLAPAIRATRVDPIVALRRE